LPGCSQNSEDAENNVSLVRDQFNVVNIATRKFVAENCEEIRNEGFPKRLIISAKDALASNLRSEPIGGAIFLNTNWKDWGGLKVVSGRATSEDFVFMLKKRADGLYWSRNLLYGGQLEVVDLSTIPSGFVKITGN